VYNLYRSVAGKEDLVLSGTGKEDDTSTLAPNGTATYAALVSTRDGKKDSSGEELHSLTIVKTADGSTTAVESASEIKLVDWFGNRLVYSVFNPSTSTNDANRYQIISYDVAKKQRVVLDHMNYLNDVLAARGSVYYATSGSGAQFVRILPDASNKKVILTSEIAAITRVGYDNFVLSGVGKWYDFDLNTLEAIQTNKASQDSSRLYIDSPDGKHSVYINGTGAQARLTVVDTKSGKETALSPVSVSYPIHWLGNETFVYRYIGTDYSIDVDGTKATKVADVFDAAGISLWHEQ
jgi:hypothetical protein